MLRVARMQRSVIEAAKYIEAEGRRGGFRLKAAMVTLTYADAAGWVGKDIREFLQRVRVWLARRGHQLRYVWVAELQERGAVHYHVLLFLPVGLTLPKPDKRGWWKHGSTRIEWAQRALAYLVKYTSKGEGKQSFPKGLRLCGSGGLTPASRAARAFSMLPAWLRSRCTPEDRPVRVEGGGWVLQASGLYLRSMWQFAGRMGQFVRLKWVGPPGEAPCVA